MRLIATVAASIVIAQCLPTLAAADVRQIRPGRTFSGSLPTNGVRRFSFAMAVGHACRIDVDQQSGDLHVTLNDSGRRTSRAVDAFEFGTESVTVIADAPTSYTVAIRPTSPHDGTVPYLVRIDCHDRSRDIDAIRSRAEDLSTKAKLLADQPNARPEAVNAANTAVSTWQEIDDKESVGRGHLLLGNLAYFSSNWGEALHHYRLAGAACEAAAFTRCSAEIANNTGLAHLKTGEVALADSQLRAAARLWQVLGLPTAEAATAINLGLLYWQTTEWDSAIREYQRARKLVRRGTHLSASLLNNIGLVFLSMADAQKAASYFSAALKETPSSERTTRDYGRIWVNFGRAAMFSGDLHSALIRQKNAITVLEKGHDPSGLADAQNNLGQILTRLRHWDDARETLHVALTGYERAHDVGGISSALHHLGVIALEAGQYTEAVERLGRALNLRLERKLNNEAAETAYLLAVSAMRQGRTDDARRYVKDALALVEIVQAHVLGEPLRRWYFANKHKYAAFYIDTLLGPHPNSLGDEEVRDLFGVAEQYRVRSLSDSLGEEHMVVSRTADPVLLERRRSLRRQLNFASQRLAFLPETPQNRKEVFRLRGEIDRLLAEDNEVEATIRADSRERSSAPVLARTEFSIRDFQTKYLSEADTILAYSLGEKRSLVWTINKQRATVSVLPGRNVIETAARRFLDLLGAVNERRGDRIKQNRFDKATVDLTRVLGLEDWPGRPVQRVIVVPDGILSRLPFSTLPVPFGASAKRPMGLVLELVQVPSLVVFGTFAERSRNPIVAPRVAVFGDPVYNESDSRLPRALAPIAVGARERGTVYQRLLFSQDEIRAVERLVPPERRWISKGVHASKQAFLSPKVTKHSLLLISAHASANDTQPELSHIALSQYDESGRATDGMVRLYDLYGLNIPSFVILSACETAKGKQLDGEGLISIMRGFISAGSTGLLASPLRVDDEATSVLVSKFLETLIGPRATTPSWALLAARRALAKTPRWSDPFYWGTFTLTAAWR